MLINLVIAFKLDKPYLKKIQKIQNYLDKIICNSNQIKCYNY